MDKRNIVQLATVVLLFAAMCGYGCAALDAAGKSESGGEPESQAAGLSWNKQAGRKIAHPEAMVNAEWLEAHYNDPDVVIIDGSDVKDGTYVEHTIKNAVHVSYRDLRKPSGIVKGVTFGLEKERFNPAPLAEIFRKAGVDEDTTVVCAAQYRVDDAGTVFWVLKWLGHEDVRLLPVNYLKALPHSMISTTVRKWNEMTPTGNFEPKPDWSWYATRDCVVRAMEDPGIGLWDARSRAYYEGRKTKTIRGGTLATARNLPFTEMWTDETRAEVDWKGAAEKIAATFPKKNGRKMKLISFCKTGHSCSVGFFAWQLGYSWAVCDASWRMLAYDGSLPVENVRLYFSP